MHLIFKFIEVPVALGRYGKAQVALHQAAGMGDVAGLAGKIRGVFIKSVLIIIGGIFMRRGAVTICVQQLSVSGTLSCAQETLCMSELNFVFSDKMALSAPDSCFCVNVIVNGCGLLHA